MLDSICCAVHENMIVSIVCTWSVFIVFIAVSSCVFPVSWGDIVSYVILIFLLLLLGGRFLLLNAGLSKNVYNEAECYANVLIDEEPSLLSAFPFIQSMEDPGNDLRKMYKKNILLKIDCGNGVTRKQCEQIEQFVMDRISSMGGKPYADLHLSISVPPSLEDSRERYTIFSKLITKDAQNGIHDFSRWALRNFSSHKWLGISALLMMAYLQSLSLVYVCIVKKSNHNATFLFLFLIVSAAFFGGFYLFNNFHHEILYCYMLELLIMPYVFLCLGYWRIRFYLQRKQAFFFINLITQFFTFISMLLALFLLFAD